MSTLGKVLAFLNLLAVVGLVYLATQDWARRHEVTGTAVLYVLHRDGLPVSDEPNSGDRNETEDSVALPVELPGGVTVDTVSPDLLAEYFRDADGGIRFIDNGTPPAKQVDEVRRVKAKIDVIMTQATMPGAKLTLLCGQFQADGTFYPGWLALMAQSFEERDLARRLANPATAGIDGVRTPSDAADLARKLLDRKFETVLNSPNPQLAQQQAEEVSGLSQGVQAAAAPVASALTSLDAATAESVQATTTAMANPKDPAARDAMTAAQDRVQALAEQVRTAGNTLRQAREPLYDALTRPALVAASDAADRRRRIAHLLIFLDDSAAWQQRVARVVGLEEYNAALSAQAERLTDITWALEQLIRADQGLFTAEYEQLKQLARVRQNVLDQQTAVTAGLATQATKDDENLKLRLRQRDIRQADLAKLRTKVAEQLAAQKVVEDQLFAVQKRVGQTLNQNFALEDQLEKAERRAMAGQ